MDRRWWLFIGELALAALIVWLGRWVNSLGRSRPRRIRMKRFGGPWGAIECEEVETPVGELCIRCKVPIKEGDEGVVMPLMETLGTWVPVSEHRDCILESILGPDWRAKMGRGA